MFKQKKENIVSAIEIGTSKICVLIGRANDDNTLEVIGHGEVPTEGAIIKGDILDMELAYELLSSALTMADDSAGGVFVDNMLSTINITGRHIQVFENTGSMPINSSDQGITLEDCQELIDITQNSYMPANKALICGSESYFEIDGKRVRTPIGHYAKRLELHMQIFSGDKNSIANFTQLAIDAGVDENSIEPLFSANATNAGVLSEDEKENGVLLVDMGAGTTEYIIEYNSGVVTGGVLQVGFDHVINDLSLGLDLKFSQVQELVLSGKLEELFTQNIPFLEIKQGKKVKSFDFNVIELIVNERLKEIFAIIKNEIKLKKIITPLDAGCVLTGGGALFSRTNEIFANTFQTSSRIGKPNPLGGNFGILNSPRYSMICGLLKIAQYYNIQSPKEQHTSSMDVLKIVGSIFNTIKRGE